MNVSGIIANRIAANTAANTLIGGRVYPGVLKQQTTYPAVCVNLISPGPQSTKTQSSDLDLALVQVDIYGSTYTTTAAASIAIRAALDYQAGTWTLTGGDTVDVAHIEYLSERDGYTDNAEMHRRLCEYRICIRNSTTVS
jgi:hypothetical protein